jgi:hypothetical protein
LDLTRRALPSPPEEAEDGEDEGVGVVLPPPPPPAVDGDAVPAAVPDAASPSSVPGDDKADDKGDEDDCSVEGRGRAASHGANSPHIAA